MTTARPPVLLLCQPADALPLPGLNLAIQNLGIPVFLLRVSIDNDAAADTDHPSYNLILNLQNWEWTTLRQAVAQLCEHYHIMGIIPPYGYSLQCRLATQAITRLAEFYHLPSYGAVANDLSRNRYLTRCAWRSAALPTPNFTLIHNAAQLNTLAADITYPVRLSPLHFALPHLSMRSLTASDLTTSHDLLSRTLTRWVLNHGPLRNEAGVDLRTHQPLHFELGHDLLLSHWQPTLSMAFTALIINHQIHILCGRQLLTRQQRKKVPRRNDMLASQQLVRSGMATLGIHTGIVDCQVQLTSAGPQLECIIPYYTDPLVIPLIEETTGRPFAELWLGIHTQLSVHSSPIVVSPSYFS